MSYAWLVQVKQSTCNVLVLYLCCAYILISTFNDMPDLSFLDTNLTRAARMGDAANLHPPRIRVLHEPLTPVHCTRNLVSIENWELGLLLRDRAIIRMHRIGDARKGTEGKPQGNVPSSDRAQVKKRPQSGSCPSDSSRLQPCSVQK